MNRKKENDLESMKCYKPQTCKIPEMKRKCVTQIRASELKRLRVVRLPQLKQRKRPDRQRRDSCLDYISAVEADDLLAERCPTYSASTGAW